jgi:hypothetical protein
MAILAHALTTVARVKARMEITASTWDSLIAELINGATDFIEGECGGRRFKSTAYTNEVYDREKDQELMMLRNWPVTTLSAAQYRPGSISSPSWTSINADDYQLVEDGKFGVVEVNLELYGRNTVRFSYTAGYTIDFSTASGHLPYEISDFCERLAVWAFKRRNSDGKVSEASQEASHSWREAMSKDDRTMLLRYARTSFL